MPACLSICRPSDHGAALAPFLAHAALGDTYRWMLYTDDDTLWMLGGVDVAVRGVDASQPAILTGAAACSHPAPPSACPPAHPSKTTAHDPSVRPGVCPK
jgi:hypothetical protein